jgi:hypothetical protein
MVRSPRYEAAAAAIDASNADDPTAVVLDGTATPLALAHGRLAAGWVETLDPDAGELRLLAARAHHLRRWESPRSAFPKDRAGYLRWRAAAKRRHADELHDLLVATGFTAADADRAGAIIRKEGLGRDAEVQVHEDAVCLAFLATQLDALVDDIGDERTIEVLRKTARKMSPSGLARASEVGLSPRGRALVAAALE